MVYLRFALVALGVSAFAASGCRPSGTFAKVSDTGGNVESSVCDIAAISAAIDQRGILEALQSDETNCLDDGSAPGADDLSVVEAPLARQGSTVILGEAGAEQAEGLALAGRQRLDLVVVLGFEVLSEVIDAVQRESMEGGDSIKKIDASKVRGQVQSLVGSLDRVLKSTDTELGLTLYYSYSDLYYLVKTRYVDPLVYGYSGIGHRIIQRRYARGRGLVYSIVSQKLAEGLNQFDARAKVEIATLAAATLKPQLIRQNGSLSMRETSLITLWSQNRVVQTLSYERAKEFEGIIRSEVQKLQASAAQ